MRTVIAWMAMLTALAGGWPVHARADGAPAAQNSGQVTVEGDLHEGTRVATSGANVPLRTALRLILPADFSINLPNAGAWAATPVTWQQGKPLVQTLRDALAGHPELVAQVDGDFQLVTIRYRQPFDARPAAQTMSEDIAPNAARIPGQAPAQTAAQNVPPMLAPATVAVPAPATIQAPQTAQTAQSRMMTPASPVFAASQAVAAHAAARNAAHAAAAGITGASPKPSGIASTQVAPGPTQVAQATQADRTPAPTEVADPALAPISAVAPAPPPVQQTWRIEPSDRTVRAALTRWAQDAGWQLVWEAPTDFSIDAAATVHGTFDEALQQVVSALAHSNAPVQAILYQGNKVLRIVAKGAA
ncbi:TcpQ domain-containing protein [Paraburkholderia sp. SOS3]|jgi:hypothetical protein|uniref:TcpQ domain-containing protein n=1 Tax=Paraburkholderia sp. SOS3 TaxID=1926494 RepID=UPI002685C726